MATGNFQFSFTQYKYSANAISEKFKRDKRILVICNSGHRSVSGAKKLMKAGFTDVASVRGGTVAWRGKLVR